MPNFEELPAGALEVHDEDRMPQGVGVLIMLGFSAIFWALVVLALA